MSDERPGGLDPFAARVAVAAEALPGLDEVRRIVALPVAHPLEPAEVEEVSRVEVSPSYLDGSHPDRRGRPFRLWRQQAEAIVAFQSTGGLFAPLKVGAGKALISWLCAKHAFQRLKLPKVLLIVPSRLFKKVTLRDVPLARKAIGLTAPVHGMHQPRGARMTLARSGWRGVYVYTYALCREEPAEEEMDAIDPDLVICDEVHAFKNVKGPAQTKRFLSLMRRRKRKFVGLSGTMAKRSLHNYAHLAHLALGDGTPLPREKQVLESWASVIDSVGQPWLQEQGIDAMKGLEPLREFALGLVRRGHVDPEDVGGPLSADPEGYRRAYRIRRNTAPGVVASADDALGTSIAIVNVPAPLLPEGRAQELGRDLARRFPGDEFFDPRVEFAAMPPEERVVALLWAIHRRSTTPNGDPISFPMHKWRWQYEVSAGFFNDLRWQAPADLAQARGISLDAAEEILARAQAHLEGKRAHDKELRYFLEGEHVSGLDTPELVGAACARGGRGVPRKLYDLWREMKNRDFEGRPDRVGRVERVSDYKVRAALEWARALPEDRGALVWVFNIEVGEWVHEVLSRELGPDRVLACPAGEAPGEVLQDRARSGDKVCVVSISGHYDGKDLEFFQENYFVQWPRQADVAQQALGRTHRPGQEAEELTIHTNHSTEFDHMNYNACLLDSIWAHQAEDEQKVITADYPEPPKQYPPEFLAQRGFADLLDRNADAALRAVLGEEGAAVPAA